MYVTTVDTAASTSDMNNIAFRLCAMEMCIRDSHYDAFFPVDNADCSFLTDFDSIAEGLEAAKNDSDNYLALVGSNSPLSMLAAWKDIWKSEDYVAAVSNLLFADQDVAPYAGMKKMILCLSMEETDEATALLLDTYCTVKMCIRDSAATTKVDLKRFIKLIRKYKDCETLTDAMLYEMVEKVVIH